MIALYEDLQPDERRYALQDFFHRYGNAIRSCQRIGTRVGHEKFVNRLFVKYCLDGSYWWFSRGVILGPVRCF